jgi:hypothetical protein
VLRLAALTVGVEVVEKSLSGLQNAVFFVAEIDFAKSTRLSCLKTQPEMCDQAVIRVFLQPR